MVLNPMYTYIDAHIDPNLTCCICRTPFTDPVTTQTCSHTFCQGCILQAISISAQCPIDRSPLSLELLVQADPIIRHMVDELLVECPHNEDGCPYVGQRQLVGTHVKSACGYQQVPCTGDECDKLVRRKDLGKGCPAVHEPEIAGCSTADCEFCKEQFPCSEFDKHVESCSEAVVRCAQETNGCAWTGPRDALEGHTKTCSYEAIKGFFALHNSRLDALTTENEILQHRVESLEGTLRTTQRELQYVQTVLEPWYRTQSQNSTKYHQPLPTPNLDSQFDTRGFNFTDSTASNAPYHLHPSLSGASHNNATPSASIADYFPPEEPPRTRNARSASLSTLQGHFSPDYTTPNITRSPIAPLNLSTTLEASLTGLRESIVTLSAALEGQGRRQELALTTEGLRTNEEVGSLKAIVHGLRMQVHAIMMDRNAQATGRFPGGATGSEGGSLIEEGMVYFSPGGGPGPWFPGPPPPLPTRFSQNTSSITKL